MKKEDYWAAHVTKNPSFSNEEKQIQIKVGMLKKLMLEAFEKGFEHGKQTTDIFADILEDLRRGR